MTITALTVMALQPLSAHARRGGGGGRPMGNFGGGGGRPMGGGGGRPAGGGFFGGGGGRPMGTPHFGGGGVSRPPVHVSPAMPRPMGPRPVHVSPAMPRPIHAGPVMGRPHGNFSFPRGYRAIPTGYYGGRVLGGYMPPYNPYFANIHYRRGYRIPLLNYPNWYWYAGTLLYFDAAYNGGTYYDQTGNEYTMPADVIEDAPVEADAALPEPGMTDPVPTEPGMTEPMPTEPVSTEPVKNEGCDCCCTIM